MFENVTLTTVPVPLRSVLIRTPLADFVTTESVNLEFLDASDVCCISFTHITLEISCPVPVPPPLKDRPLLLEQNAWLTVTFAESAITTQSSWFQTLILSIITVMQFATSKPSVLCAAALPLLIAFGAPSCWE